MDIQKGKFRQDLMDRINDFREKTGASRWRIGMDSTGDHRIVQKLERGEEILLSSADKIINMMENYKPN